jgi:hypothetical protein
MPQPGWSRKRPNIRGRSKMPKMQPEREVDRS